METIQACVSTRLLSKADRLFTGSLEGRVIEILQNARRAGATKVEITNKDSIVTVHDNGQGIESFSKLLDLGGSGWEDSLEASEDPAGVGIFCLAPRDVTIRSNGKMATIGGDGWTGAPVSIRDDPDPVQGTILRFKDEAWTSSAVDLRAVFCGMDVVVDGTACPKQPFVSENAAHHPELGCSIEVRQSQDLNPWHHSSQRERWRSTNVLVNFHGQVVALDYRPVSEQYLCILVNLTGEPTGIRLMLPARTCLIENRALEQLKAAMELEAYHHIHRRGHHSLPHKEYLRAKEIGIDLPEAKPTYTVGLLSYGDPPEPTEVVIPKDFPLSQCYRFDHNSADGHESDEANAHLLAALGKFEQPFVPVGIRREYDGYSWAKLPTIQKVEVALGKKLHDGWLWSGTLSCVDSLTITAHLSDGRVVSSPVCMAIAAEPSKKSPTWATDHVLVTPEAQERLRPSEIWHHLGGWSDEGDSYETQEFSFEQDLERFWANLIGPDEQLRRNLLAPLQSLTSDWTSVTITSSGGVTFRYADGTSKTIQPPASPATE